MQNLEVRKQTPSLMELSPEDLDNVGGGSEDSALATGVSTALVIGAATVASPLIAGALAAAAVIASGFAIYYAATDDETISAT